MKLKLIDEDWIDEQLEYLKLGMKGMSVAKWKWQDAIDTFELIKSELKSPKEEIEKAFQAGEEQGRVVALFNNTDNVSRWEMEHTPDLEEYLKDNNYE